MSDYGTFMSDEYSRDHDDVAAREKAVDRAICRMVKMSGKEQLEYTIDLLRAGGMKDGDLADVLSQGAYAGKDAWQAVSEAFEEGAWQEYIS